MATGSDPFADLLTLQRDMDRIMTKFGAQPRHAGDDGHTFWMPAVDVFKQGGDMVVRVELPGVVPADISVSVTGNMLTVKGERRQEQGRAEGDWVMRESSYGAFERRITMPEDIDASQVRAQYRAGILEVTVPASALVTPRPQPVQVSGAQQQPVGAGQSQYPAQPAAPQQYQTPQQYPAPEQQAQPCPPQQPGGYQQQAGGGQQAYGQQQPQVEVQGGWVVPQQPPAPQSQQPAQPSEQQMGTSYATEQAARAGEQPSQEDPRRRSRLGEWLHGDER